MENRQLFLQMMADLNERLQADSEYEIFSIARLVRQLLFDGNRVIQAIISDQVLELVGERIPLPPRVQFEVADYKVPLAGDSMWWAVLDGFDPEREVAWRYFHGNRKRLINHIYVQGTLESQKMAVEVYPMNGQDFEVVAGDSVSRTSVKLHAFLRKVVMLYGDEVFSVQDIVRYNANFGGAVHTGRAVEEREKALEAIMHRLYIGELPLGVYMLLPIGRVVYRALQVLREYVESGPLWQRAHWRIEASPSPDGSAAITIRSIGGEVALVPRPGKESDGRATEE